MKRVALAGLLIVATLLTGCATVDFSDDPEIVRTWNQALIVLPPLDGPSPLVARRQSRDIARYERRLSPDVRFPTVILMHGCTGIGNIDFLEELARQGFAVVAPDSFARRYRPLQCDPRTRRGGQNLFVYDFRSAELTYALEHLHELQWVDLDNLFLIGASEGGVTAALFRAATFNARVIVQWTCTGAALVAGIDAPPQTPILAIVREDDPYYAPGNTPGQQGHCGHYLAGRPGSRSLVVPRDPAGDEHDVLSDPGASRAVIEFLRGNQAPAQK